MTTEDMSADMTVDAAKGVAHEALTTTTYTPTPYQDVSWPIVGQFLNQCYFEAEQFKVLTKDGFQTDPMFADYTPEEAAGRSGASQGRFAPNAEAESEVVVVEQLRAEISRLQAEREVAVEEARLQGIAEGEARGLEAAQQEVVEMHQRYAEVIQDIGAQLNESIADTEKKAAAMAVDIARKLVTAFTDTHRDYILPLVREALSLSAGATIRSVRVSERDFEFLKLQDLSQYFSDPARAWTFEPDPMIKLGCVVSMAAGEIDYRVEVAWQRIRDRTLQVLGISANDQMAQPEIMPEASPASLESAESKDES